MVIVDSQLSSRMMNSLEFNSFNAPLAFTPLAGDLQRICAVFARNRHGLQQAHRKLEAETGGLGDPEGRMGGRRYQLRRWVEAHLHPDSEYTAHQLAGFLLEETVCVGCGKISAEVFRACEFGHQICGNCSRPDFCVGFGCQLPLLVPTDDANLLRQDLFHNLGLVVYHLELQNLGEFRFVKIMFYINVCYINVC